MSLTEKIKDSVDSLRTEVGELKEQLASLLKRRDERDQLDSEEESSALRAQPTDLPTSWTWPGWPNIDVKESDDHFKVLVDLPGLDKKDVELSVDGRRLVLSARHSAAQEIEDSGWVRRERISGSFVRTLELPAAVSSDACHAKMRHGVLEIELRKLTPGRSTRLIDVA